MIPMKILRDLMVNFILLVVAPFAFVTWLGTRAIGILSAGEDE